MRTHRLPVLLAALLVGAWWDGSATRVAQAAAIESAWSRGKAETQARLVAGSYGGRTLAAVEIALADGWKTYWRSPGDGGGVPPSFNWDKSTNLARATVLYPVPTRFADKAGDTLGYKGVAVFPVEIVAKDLSKPVTLVLALDYGVCRDICVPVDAELTLEVPGAGAEPVAAVVAAALERVARSGAAVRPTDPKLLKTEVRLVGAHPSIAIEAHFPGGTTNAAAFVENTDGSYMPLTKPEATTALGQDRLRFELDLTGTADPADIRGKDAKVTLVSEQGLSEAIFKLE